MQLVYQHGESFTPLIISDKAMILQSIRGAYNVEELQYMLGSIPIYQLHDLLKSVYRSGRWPDNMENKIIYITPEGSVYVRDSEITYDQAAHLSEQGHVVGLEVDPNKQHGITQGNTKVTILTSDGLKYDVVAKYDAATNYIQQPY